MKRPVGTKSSADTTLLLTVKQVAHLLELGVRSVWRQASSGELPAPISIGGSTRWERGAIEEYVRDKVAAGLR